MYPDGDHTPALIMLIEATDSKYCLLLLILYVQSHRISTAPLSISAADSSHHYKTPFSHSSRNSDYELPPRHQRQNSADLPLVPQSRGTVWVKRGEPKQVQESYI